jgi:hypothetical protein
LNNGTIDKINNLADCLRLVEPDKDLYDNFLLLEGLVSIPPYRFDGDEDAFMTYLGLVYPGANIYRSKYNLFVIEKRDEVCMVVFNPDNGYFDRHIVVNDILYFNGNTARRKFVLNSLKV